ncbi:hypothetical protein Cgig2_026747 [Carnegiea gigantea]|uniref:Uncharacterized protein n=1 Tax=Carnegiea gigantea TaxID=171969 RepID=A0A9Q1JU78_9CARY|nr:hypothetical protein Cgig2_026747 [Carnegiea gigantea]
MWRTVHGRHASRGFQKLGLCNGRPCGHRPELGKFRDLDGGFRKLPSLQRSLSGVPSMAFLRSLSTKEMPEHVVRHFEWDHRGIAFPLSPLLKDFQALCPSREAWGLTWRALRTLELALTELCWSTFESLVWLYGDRIFEVQFRTKAELEESSGPG